MEMMGQICAPAHFLQKQKKIVLVPIEYETE
jgi:hypothetical protein